MALDELEAEKLVTELWPRWLSSREKSKEWEAWALGRQALPTIPDSATAEYRHLQEKAITPWLSLVVRSFAQALIVEGYRTTGAAEDNQLWSVWQANAMDAKQTGIYDAALTTGVAYVAVLPADMPEARSAPMIDDAPMPEWRAYSSAELTAFYDRAYADYPTYAIAAEPAPAWQAEIGASERWNVTLFDEHAVYVLRIESSADRNVDGSHRYSAVLQDVRPHGMSECPVVRYVNRYTIDGHAIGEVEPYTALASRIDQDVFDRLVVQRFASWRVRWATGLVVPKDEDEKKRFEAMLRISDILASDSADTKFGSMPETPMDGHLRAPIEDVRMLSAVSQTPPTHLTGDLANISAEALAAIEAAHNRKIEQLKVTFGEAHERCFALTAELLAREADESAQVRWRDMESRSLGQQADAFGKLAQMLEIPVEVLWDKLGFLTEQDRERARELRAQGDGFGELIRELSNGQTSPVPAAPEQLPAAPAA